MMAPPKPGVCPLPILAALPALDESSFFARTAVPHGTIEQAKYTNYAGVEKRLHVYLPPGYEQATDARYPVLYLNHGGGDDDAKWSSEDLRGGGNAGSILDNLIAENRARPILIVMIYGMTNETRIGGLRDFDIRPFEIKTFRLRTK